MMSTTRHSTQYVSKGFSCGKGVWQVGGFTHWMNRRNGLLDGRLWPIDSILPTYLPCKIERTALTALACVATFFPPLICEPIFQLPPCMPNICLGRQLLCRHMAP
jgi:hypothetical protein